MSAIKLTQVEAELRILKMSFDKLPHCTDCKQSTHPLIMYGIQVTCQYSVIHAHSVL